MPALDGVRGLAIATVMAFHYYLFDHHLAPAHWVYLFTRGGWLGVDLFFVLSGFLITGLLLDQKEGGQKERGQEERGAGGFFRTFYVRRTLRIFPLYYAVLLLVFGALAWTPAFDEPSFHALEGEQVWLWLYLVNWVNWARGTLVFVSDSFEANHFWSLAAEEQFYLLWPALVRFVPRRAFPALCGAIVVASFAAKAALGPGEEALMLFRADGLVLGGLVAALVREPDARALVERAALPVVGSTVIALGVLFVIREGLRHDDPWMARVGCSLAAVGAAAGVVAAIRAAPGSAAGRLLRARPLALLGRYSYGIYVLHWAFHPFFERYAMAVIPREPTGVALLDGLWVVAVKSAAAIGAAVLSYHLFEERFLVLKDRLAPSRPAA
jgi:peptidoglycan/LPS O-acetylase OafA/YrhL